MARGSPDIVERGRATQFTNGGQAARNAGKKSGEVRRGKSTVRSTMRLLANTTVARGKRYDLENLKSMSDLTDETGNLTHNLTVAEIITLKIIQGALEDDPECRRLFLELSGAMAEDTGDQRADGALPDLIRGLKEE